MSAQRFPIRFTGANRAMALLGVTRRGSFGEVGDDRVRVRMGWAFRTKFPGVAIEPPARAWSLFPIGLRELVVSLEDPAGFLSALGGEHVSR